ncbi:MAG TPA: hypothetical protein IAB21_02890 [Candidatus Avelusimicrobium excrementipullorum]|nr:hypothetical protein [Candidatus Avelusimicrobium excrementipullorum]
MADENKNTPDVAEFEAKMPAQTGNKDLWLFLIIVDVVFLCVFGFFLYKNLSARLLSSEDEKQPAPAAVQEAAPAPEEEIAVAEEVVAVTPAEPAVQPQPEPKPAEPEVKPAEPEPQPQAQPAEKKESIVVKTNGKSRYRQVTFRYFGDADSVSVVSGFTMAKPRALKKRGDHWEVTLGIAPGTYKFLYIVDGKQTLDPYAEEDDGRSVLVVK